MKFFSRLLLSGLFLSTAALSAPCDPTVPLTIEIKDMRFFPEFIEVCQGQTVTWVNVDQTTTPTGARMAHTVTADPAKAKVAANVLLPEGVAPFDSGRIGPDGIFSFKFDILGDYKYICRPHELHGHLGALKVVTEFTPPALPIDSAPAQEIDDSQFDN